MNIFRPDICFEFYFLEFEFSFFVFFINYENNCPSLAPDAYTLLLIWGEIQP
jgi:hypothetical protein